MTGEMRAIDQNGQDDDGNIWEIHAAIAKAIGGELCPFDQYQGPYIVVGSDARIGQAPYQLAVQNVGIKRLWVVPDPIAKYLSQIYREDTDTLSATFLWNDINTAIIRAKEVLTV